MKVVPCPAEQGSSEAEVGGEPVGTAGLGKEGSLARVGL